MLGLSPLDDGRHRHHRLLLLHHLARLPARSTFTRHRGPIYFADLFAHTHTTTPSPPRGPHHPAARPFRFFSDGTLSPSAPRHLAKEVLPSTLSFPPSLELKLLLLVSIWYGCSLHFFGSFVIDRATGCLTILQQKEKSGFFRSRKG